MSEADEKQQNPGGDQGSGELDTAGARFAFHSTTGCAPCQGAFAIARLVRGDDPEVELETLPEPWRGIAGVVASADKQDRWRAFATALAGLEGGAKEIQSAVYEAEARLDAPPEPPGELLGGNGGGAGGNLAQGGAGGAVGAHCTDLGNAQRMVALFGQDLKYCYPLDTWFFWDGRVWMSDVSGEIERLAKGVVQSIYREAGQAADDEVRKYLARWAIRSESATKLRNLVYLARSELAISPDEFDVDPWLLNCENGTIDLRSGELRPHRRGDLITRMAPVRFDPAARLPMWDGFLEDVTGGYAQTQQFLARAMGLSASGRISEEKLFMLIGPGRTGKTTFLEACKAALDGYAATADFGTFLRGHAVDKPRADLARLRGARLVTAAEADNGAALDEATIKLITGGDTIAARHLFKSSFEFRPSFKIWLCSNQAPRVSDRDDAIWRRIVRIPFAHIVPAAKADPAVKETLCDPEIAGPAILAWIVRGCLAWQREGLGSCPAVDQATEEYRAEMDSLQGFIDECCVLAPGAWVPAKDLRQAYEDWARENGVAWGVQGREWGERLRDIGGEPGKVRRVGDKTVRGWQGIGLLGGAVQEELPG